MTLAPNKMTLLNLCDFLTGHAAAYAGNSDASRCRDRGFAFDAKQGRGLRYCRPGVLNLFLEHQCLALLRHINGVSQGEFS